VRSRAGGGKRVKAEVCFLQKVLHLLCDSSQPANLGADDTRCSTASGWRHLFQPDLAHKAGGFLAENTDSGYKYQWVNNQQQVC
jgi:hypothetical protein